MSYNDMLRKWDKEKKISQQAGDVVINGSNNTVTVNKISLDGYRAFFDVENGKNYPARPQVNSNYFKSPSSNYKRYAQELEEIEIKREEDVPSSKKSWCVVL